MQTILQWNAVVSFGAEFRILLVTLRAFSNSWDCWSFDNSVYIDDVSAGAFKLLKGFQDEIKIILYLG